MFDHVTIRVANRDASERFYSHVLGTLGIEPTANEDWLGEWDDFSLSPASEDKPVTRGLHVGFRAESRAAVDAWWRAGVDAGYESDGEPGPRPQYTPDYYGAFLLDPDGNSTEAVHHGGVRAPGWIDHLWIRVADLDAARAFYEQAAPHAGFEPGETDSGGVMFEGEGGSFSLISDERDVTENLHIAFPAADNTAVDRFHAAMLEAGHPDNGGPGERPEYHSGYYGAFVLDPDGNNVELVCHNR